MERKTSIFSTPYVSISICVLLCLCTLCAFYRIPFTGFSLYLYIDAYLRTCVFVYLCISCDLCVCVSWFFGGFSIPLTVCAGCCKGRQYFLFIDACIYARVYTILSVYAVYYYIWDRLEYASATAIGLCLWF